MRRDVIGHFCCYYFAIGQAHPALLVLVCARAGEAALTRSAMTCAVGARPGRFSDGIARPVMAVGALRKLALPCQRVGNNGLQIVKMRFPIESGADAIAGGDELGGVARAAAGELDKSTPETRFTLSITSSTEKPRP
jgi:hypothetical protein